MLLLYKDAVDMTHPWMKHFGAMNWKRSHKEVKGNLFCTIGVWDGEKWVEKEDVGIESMTEGEKGEASDSFKRAGTNWGIGRELYTSPPKIMVKLDPVSTRTRRCLYPSTYLRLDTAKEGNSKLPSLTATAECASSGTADNQRATFHPPRMRLTLKPYRADVEAMCVV